MPKSAGHVGHLCGHIHKLETWLNISVHSIACSTVLTRLTILHSKHHWVLFHYRFWCGLFEKNEKLILFKKKGDNACLKHNLIIICIYYCCCYHSYNDTLISAEYLHKWPYIEHKTANAQIVFFQKGEEILFGNF